MGFIYFLSMFLNGYTRVHLRKENTWIMLLALVYPISILVVTGCVYDL